MEQDAGNEEEQKTTVTKTKVEKSTSMEEDTFAKDSQAGEASTKDGMEDDADKKEVGEIVIFIFL